MRTLVFTEIPDPNIASTIATDELPLVWVDDHIIDRYSMRVVSLNSSRACVPDLDGSIFRAGYHPFALTVERYTGDVGSVAVKGKHRIGVRRLDIVELDSMVAGGGKVALVWRDTKTIDLGIWVWNSAGADSRKRLPKAGREMNYVRAVVLVTERVHTGHTG